MRENMMSKVLRNTILIKSEDERKEEEDSRKEELDARRTEERAAGIAEDELSAPAKSSLLEEYVSSSSRSVAKLIGYIA